MVTVRSHRRIDAWRRRGQRALVAAGTASLLGALWIATPVQSLAVDAVLPVTCPNMPASPAGTPSQAPSVSTPCPTIFSNSAPSSLPTSRPSQGLTQTAASSGTSARSSTAALSTSEQRESAPTAAAVAYSRPEDSLLVLNAASIPSPVVDALFGRRGTPRTPQMFVAALVGIASGLILLVSFIFTLIGTYDFQRFLAHRRMYA